MYFEKLDLQLFLYPGFDELGAWQMEEDRVRSCMGVH
jgi:hypothetical protein